ncbi:polycystin-1 [Anaeramoeba ignava]|uniref:Polycystin-1 n=1 Tax=Anaeramoeba ignava TaxID=1746090 RepID=A0A9Q0LRY4_ANAIG|nr:polycystin-1 [Anaeramoeba ignava]
MFLKSKHFLTILVFILSFFESSYSSMPMPIFLGPTSIGRDEAFFLDASLSIGKEITFEWETPPGLESFCVNQTCVIPEQFLETGYYNFDLTVTDVDNQTAVNNFSFWRLSTKSPVVCIKSPSTTFVHKNRTNIFIVNATSDRVDIKNHLYSWELINEISGTVPLGSFGIENEKQELYLDFCKIDPSYFGSLKFSLVIAVQYQSTLIPEIIMDPKTANEAINVEIIPADLSVVIKGGIRRTISISSDIILDGSDSRDPDLCEDSYQNLNFEWFCKTGFLYNDDCFMNPVFSTDPIVNITAGTLFEGYYKFVLKVTSNSTEYKEEYESVYIFVIDTSTIPSVQISATPEFSEINKNRQIILHATIKEFDDTSSLLWDTFNIQWSIVERGTDFTIDIDDKTKFPLPSSNTYLLILPDSLIPSNSYTFRFTAKLKNNPTISGFAEYEIETKSPPNDVSIISTPSDDSVADFSTTFDIQMSELDYSEDQIPLKFQAWIAFPDQIENPLFSSVFPLTFANLAQFPVLPPSPILVRYSSLDFTGSVVSTVSNISVDYPYFYTANQVNDFISDSINDFLDPILSSDIYSFFSPFLHLNTLIRIINYNSLHFENHSFSQQREILSSNFGDVVNFVLNDHDSYPLSLFADICITSELLTSTFDSSQIYLENIIDIFNDVIEKGFEKQSEEELDLDPNYMEKYFNTLLKILDNIIESQGLSSSKSNQKSNNLKHENDPETQMLEILSQLIPILCMESYSCSEIPNFSMDSNNQTYKAIFKYGWELNNFPIEFNATNNRNFKIIFYNSVFPEYLQNEYFELSIQSLEDSEISRGMSLDIKYLNGSIIENITSLYSITIPLNGISQKETFECKRYSNSSGSWTNEGINLLLLNSTHISCETQYLGKISVFTSSINPSSSTSSSSSKSTTAVAVVLSITFILSAGVFIFVYLQRKYKKNRSLSDRQAEIEMDKITIRSRNLMNLKTEKYAVHSENQNRNV